MNHTLRGVIVACLALAVLVAAGGAVRWAKKGGTAASLTASVLIMTFGIGLIATHPQRVVQQAEEQRERGSEESGDPPWMQDKYQLIIDRTSQPPQTSPRVGRRWNARISKLLRTYIPFWTRRR